MSENQKKSTYTKYGIFFYLKNKINFLINSTQTLLQKKPLNNWNNSGLKQFLIKLDYLPTDHQKNSRNRTINIYEKNSSMFAQQMLTNLSILKIGGPSLNNK